jgi:hypothetical protein
MLTLARTAIDRPVVVEEEEEDEDEVPRTRVVAPHHDHDEDDEMEGSFQLQVCVASHVILAVHVVSICCTRPRFH